MHHGTQLPARPALDAVNQGCALLHQISREAQLVLQEVTFGQVVSAASKVFGTVLPEVDQLQRCANGIALCQRGVVVHAIQMQHQTAHGVGGSSAVIQQRGAVFVALPHAGVDHVLLKSVEQVKQGLCGQMVALNCLAQRAKNSSPSHTGGPIWDKTVLKISTVLAQIVESVVGWFVSFIGDVIGGPRKVVERLNGGS